MGSVLTGCWVVLLGCVWLFFGFIMILSTTEYGLAGWLWFLFPFTVLSSALILVLGRMKPNPAWYVPAAILPLVAVVAFVVALYWDAY